MRKKILIAEKSEAIRNIAESILHQNGYDVISTETADKAKELIITSEPNMVIIDADLKDKNNAYLYEILEESEQTASIPLIIVADPNGRDLSYPPEAILPRPFASEEFLEKIRLFIGAGTVQKSDEKIAEIDPFSISSVNDEFLDAALGIDSIDVESSEVMDKTTITENAHKKKLSDTDSSFGIAQKCEQRDKSDEDSGRVESLMIREDESVQAQVIKAGSTDLTASSKIEISGDQYGIAEPSKVKKPPEEKATSHDYDWFISEMKKDTKGIKFAKPPGDTDSQRLETVQNAEGMEPIKFSSGKNAKSLAPQIKSGGVDQFISEFKREMEHLSPELTQPNFKQGRNSTDSLSQPQDAKIKLTEIPSELDLVQLSDFIAEKIISQLLERIDRKEISELIREYLIHFLDKKK